MRGDLVSEELCFANSDVGEHLLIFRKATKHILTGILAVWRIRKLWEKVLFCKTDNICALQDLAF